ncbi:MAG: putative D-alanine--D-alanine ligase [Clostridia bacterium]|nr:putative D-alanine--D-alanine ligase [Clostridia bacterium]
MEEIEPEVPLPKGRLAVGVVYNLKKGVLAAAPDAEAEFDSIETVYAIKSALEAEGHSVILLEADKALPEKLRNTHIDIAFNIAEGIGGRGREAQLPAILNYFGIPFTGSDETTLCLALDKALTKRIMASYKINTPKYTVLSPDKSFSSASLKFPVIIKPNAEGSSKGISDISIVKSAKELHELANKNIELYNEAMLAEEYIEGREFTVGILGNGKETRVFPPMEIVYKKGTQESFHVYSYNVKQNYKEYIKYECPASLTKEQAAEMTDMAKKIYTVLDCRDFSRIDFRMSATDNKIYFIEINPLPGLAPGYSDYPMLAEFCGVGYKELVNGILNAAIKRLKIGN